MKQTRAMQSKIGFGVFLGLTFLLALFTPVTPNLIEGGGGFLLSFGLSVAWSLLLAGGLIVYGRPTLWMIFGAPFAYLWPLVAITAQFVGPYD
jgi:hypothetical protein